MKVVGLTGGIATGKSTVSAVIEQEGVALVDCDKIAKDCVKQGRWGYDRVVKAFGNSILQADGEIDRAALRKLIFTDSAARTKLNHATHYPVFLKVFYQTVWLWLKFQPLMVIDMPLLFETGFNQLTSANICVLCADGLQIERLIARDKCTREEAEAKVSSQMPLAKKRQLCDFVIDNNGSMEETRRQLTGVELQTAMILKEIKQHSLLHQIFLGPGIAVATIAAVLQFLMYKL